MITYGFYAGTFNKRFQSKEEEEEGFLQLRADSLQKLWQIVSQCTESRKRSYFGA
jgi:hypothetical protein